MTNKYLEKIAEGVEKKRPSVVGSVAEAGVGVALVSKVPEHVLGYHTLYHGTSNSKAESIMKGGFDPTKGGSGAAGHSGRGGFTNQSAGKVHFTKNKSIARFFAGYTEAGENIKVRPSGNAFMDELNKTRKHNTSTYKGIARVINPFSPAGKVIKTRVSDKAWQGFETDPHMGNSKNGAATTTKKVGTHSIHGHSDNRGYKQFTNKENLKGYYSTSAGRIRSAKGLGLGLLGAGLIGHTIYKNLKKDED